MNTRLRRLLAVTGSLGLAHAAACYEYVPATVATPAAGSEVRLQLTPEGTTDLAQYFGPRVVAVDGKLSSVAADGAMLIAASSVQIVDGARQRWTGAGAVAVPTKYVTGVQLRTVDRRKSTIAGVVIVGCLAAAGTLFMRGGSGNAPTGTGPGTGVFTAR